MATNVQIECYGGGGQGAWYATSGKASGGGGGAYSKLNSLAVTNATGYTVTVGTGATGGTPSNNFNGGIGGDSWFSTSGTILAKGGGGGSQSSGSNSAGVGGSATYCWCPCSC
jgi:hypothetical protein